MLRRLLTFTLLLLVAISSAQERIRDVIYAKKQGAAFTLDVFKPAKPNGAAIIWVVSGGWFSAHEQINLPMAAALNQAGFTVFQVVHGSQPKYVIPEIVEQVQRSVRFIKANAATYGIDPNRIGITGGSAGGHLSLMIGGTAAPGSPDARDPIDREDASVRAVVAFFPPTNFGNFAGSTAAEAMKNPTLSIFIPAFGITKDTTPEKLAEIGEKTSPIRTVSAKFPPTLFIHGDKDRLVPLQQSEQMRDALKAAGVTTDLVVVTDGGHDGATVAKGLPRLIQWFTEKLAK